ncbi:hypothetical protein C4Q31_15920 [Leptospira borgpetersenii serovar Ceylonica]|nr:hypothetical protein C4Q31_15920 [Leptospira borgpetersenii serovar Ceylonica]OOV45154.1 hypothetical protein B1H38_06345 [Leptospira borgpetersenii serovar Ballum]
MYVTIQFFIEVLRFGTFILTVSVSFFVKTFIGSKNRIYGRPKARFLFLRDFLCLFINASQKNCLKTDFIFLEQD